jgi:hypothetical protein
MPDSSYRMVVARLSDEDVLEALRNHEKYVDDMLLALLDECAKRKLQLQGVDRLRSMIEARAEIEPEVETLTIEEAPKGPIPVLFSQTAILAFTIFFSPLFGGILLALNIKTVKKPGMWQVVSLSLLFTMVSGLVTYYILPPGSFFAILIPIVFALLMSELIWTRFIVKKVEYERKSILIPLLVALLITIPIIYYVYTNPELMEFTNPSK